jgi:hypothetical protein
MRPPRSFAVLCALCLAVGLSAIGRADPTPSQIAIARVRLECLLHDRQQARDAILAEQRRTQAHLAQIQSFRGRLDPSINAASISVADQAIARDQNALAQIAQRLALLDQAIAQTRRVIANLIPPPRQPSLFEQARRAGNVSLANAMNCGGSPDSLRAMADLSLPARLFAADFCGLRSDAAFESNIGLSRGPERTALIARLNRIVARLNTVSPNTSVRLLDGCPAEGGGAFSTSTTSYIGECFLGAGHSDDEVAFTVAHERAHVSMQHASLRYIQEALERRGLSSQTTDPDVIRVALMANLGEFSREHEYEADLTGALAAMSAGFSPRGIHETMNHLSRPPPGPGSARRALQQMAATHPSPADREHALEAVFGAQIWNADPASGRCPRRDTLISFGSGPNAHNGPAMPAW